MPIEITRLKEINLPKSSYGCGATNCARCYPLQYACDWCFTEFDNPLPFGEALTCPVCEWKNGERGN